MKKNHQPWNQTSTWKLPLKTQRREKVKRKTKAKQRRTNKMKGILSTYFILTMVFITSWNCNGLCNVDKMKMVFSLFEDRKYDIVALQETHWKDNYILFIV